MLNRYNFFLVLSGPYILKVPDERILVTMDDGLYLPYLGSRYTFYLPYLPVRFMDPVCEQGIISKSPTDLGS